MNGKHSSISEGGNPVRWKPVGSEVCREGETPFQELLVHEMFNSRIMPLLLKFTENK